MLSGLHRMFGPDLRSIVDAARAVEAAGADELLLGDHMLMGSSLEDYPYGSFRWAPEEPWPEPLTALAAVAGATSRIRIGTGILIVPLRPAVLLADTATTLDVLMSEAGASLMWTVVGPHLPFATVAEAGAFVESLAALDFGRVRLPAAPPGEATPARAGRPGAGQGGAG